jgi:hypothetical protein
LSKWTSTLKRFGSTLVVIPGIDGQAGSGECKFRFKGVIKNIPQLVTLFELTMLHLARERLVAAQVVARPQIA